MASKRETAWREQKISEGKVKIKEQGKAKGSKSDRHRVAPIWQQQVAKSQVPTPKERESAACLVHETWPKTKTRADSVGPFWLRSKKHFSTAFWVDGPPLLRALVAPGPCCFFFFHADVTWRSYGAQQLASSGLGLKSRGTVSRTMVRCGEGRAISGGRLLHCVRGKEGRIFAAAIGLL